MNDVIHRLAAANPVPTGAPLRSPKPMRLRRPALAVALAVAVTVPAVAFAGRLGDLLGIANEGTPVSTSDVLPGQSKLDEALQEMNVGSTMQFLGTLNGVAFYAKRNAGGHFCLAIDHVNEPYEKGVFCDLRPEGFPSAEVRAVSFPRMLQGVAADGVASVALLDAAGNVLDSTPVVNNLFVSGGLQPQGEAAYLETLDANGGVLTKQPLP